MPSITLTIPADSGGTTLLNDFCDATDYEGDGSAKDKRGHLKAHLIAFAMTTAKNHNKAVGEKSAQDTSDTAYSTIVVT
jgi:hypothetical protein